MAKTINSNIIIKFEESGEQTVGNITKIVGLVKAKYMIPIIDSLNLEANPRSSKTGAVTDAIQETIENDPNLFPFMTKGILLAAAQYERLERNRIKIMPEDPTVEGILDGGHNTLAIGLYLLKQAMDLAGKSMNRNSKTWDDFKALWEENRDLIDEYISALQNNPDLDDFSFLVPVELLVPRDVNDSNCVFEFKNELLNVCAARNNNVQLQVSAKANQKGYFDDLKKMMEEYDPKIAQRIEWKTNDGGDIKAQDLVALAWIPLNLINPVRDEDLERTIEAVAPNKLYSGKGACLTQFEKLMSSPDVTIESDKTYKRELGNDEVESAFRIAVELPTLYDYIYEMFPQYYNATGGLYGRISAVKGLNEKRKKKEAPFTGKKIDTLSPDGFIVPLVYGLQALMEKKTINGKEQIVWTQAPLPFLMNNLEKIVRSYSGILSMCDYDPQKVGKKLTTYDTALNTFKMAVAGIL